jgi:CheY-like chemotaxis protein
VPEVLFDSVRLRQILLLLAARAREAMPGGGQLHIGAEHAEITPAAAAAYPYHVAPGDYALLVVRDEGAPLAQAELESIFEPFAVSLGSDATGLELSSVYGTIKQAGGYVWVDSGERGTAFRMYLPLAVEPLPLLPGPATPERGDRTVLVVEDDASVRAVVCQSLLRRGYYVIEAQDGREALQVVETRGGRPDALITDLLMPGMGGRELAQELISRYGAFPVLYISGYTHDALLAESVLEPGETLLSKPFSTQQLVNTLRDVMEGVSHT